MHRHHGYSFAFGCFAMLIAASAANFLVAADSKTDAKIIRSLDSFGEFFRSSLTDAGIVGGSFVFVHDNRLLAEKVFGEADRENGLPVDSRTIFHWASITKTFTGIAVMQLRDRGLLRLEDPVVRYLPELRQCHNPFGDMDDITIRHLMTHTSGFRTDTWPWKDKPWHPFEPTGWEQIAAMLPYTEILFKPGTAYQHSNPAMIFLARIIEQLTGDDFEVYIDKNILKPLEMYESYFDKTPYHLLPHRARSYFRAGDKLAAAPFDVDTGITVSNGGLNAPLTDFLKYLNFLIGDPRKQAVYEGILKRTSLEEMFQPFLAMGENASRPLGGDSERKDFIGLTYFIEDNFGMRFIGHSGSQNGFISQFFYQPERRAAYAVTFNTTATPATPGDAADKRNTRALNQLLKQYLLKNVFSIIPVEP
jgi:CubicO group peptidase (beta-lactamase class C family)